MTGVCQSKDLTDAPTAAEHSCY